MAQERARGAIVDVLDNAKLLKAGKKIALAKGANPTLGDLMTADYTYVLCKSKSGLAVVNTEGVGQVETPEGIGVHLTFAMDLVSFSIPTKDILDARTNKTMDLAEVVRSFGSRLESNFWMWRENYVGRA